MRFGGLFGREMSESVDRIERRINGPFQMKSSHVTDGDFRRKVVFSESLVAVSNGLLVEIIPADLVARFCKLQQQTPCSGGRFKERTDFASRVKFEASFEEMKLRTPVRAEQQLVVLGKVIDAGLDGIWHELSQIE